MKPDRNDLKLGTVVVLNSRSKPMHFWFKRSRSEARGHHYELLALPSYLQMQLQSSNFVHKCNTGSYCLRITNYVRMGRVSQSIFPC